MTDAIQFACGPLLNSLLYTKLYAEFFFWLFAYGAAISMFLAVLGRLL